LLTTAAPEPGKIGAKIKIPLVTRNEEPAKTAEGGLIDAAVWRDADPRIAETKATSGMQAALNAGTCFEKKIQIRSIFKLPNERMERLA
jgi:hypothetical protein